MMVRFSIKQGDQTAENESPNLVNKTGLAKRSVPKLFFISVEPLID